VYAPLSNRPAPCSRTRSKAYAGDSN